MSNEELVAVIQAGAPERMGELWEQVCGLVKWKANHVMTAMEGCPGRGVEFDDLYQSGYLAMVKAVESYDPAAGAFSTWLVYHLKTAFAEVTGYRTQRGRKEPLNTAFSLDKPLTDEADSSLFGDFIPDRKATATLEAVEDREYQKQLHDALEIALGAVPNNYGEVLRLRYYQDMTLEECGDALGVGAERVRQMENKGLRFLRQPKNAACLRPFFDFNFFCYTGMSAFMHTGMSVQERYLIAEEEQQRKAEARKRERERQRREKKIQDDYEITMEQLRADVNARISAMPPEEKRALLEKYGYA